MNANPQSLDEALEELDNEAEEVEPLEALDFRRLHIKWDILEDMGVDFSE